ncbi:MAG: YdcF family protein [Gammaproteobacteria bacterium]
METLIKAAAKGLVLPPGTLILLLVIGLLLLARGKKSGTWIIFLGVISLYALSTPLASYYLAREVETVPPLVTENLDIQSIGAIVILGGGRRSEAPEYQGKDTVSDPTLVRLRYGAELHRRFGLPVLVSGGSVFGDRIPVGVLMEEALRRDFGVKEVWVEDQSVNTYENAQLSKQLLEERGIDHVILVTQAFHMPRSLEAFKQAGLKVTAAPTDFTAIRRPSPVFLDFVPRAGALDSASRNLHELIGQLWYRWRHY